MRFPQPLMSGVLLRRYQRFLADIRLDDGRTVTAHCPNPGSMKTCTGPEWPVRLSHHPDPRRRLPYTLEMIHNGTCWIGVNTAWPNHLAEEAIRADLLPSLAGASDLRREVRYGAASRVDLLATVGGRACWVEVKNVTLAEGDGYYRFPDARTVRGLKHLHELSARVAAGDRAMMLYVVSRSDAHTFAPAHAIDPDYAAGLRAAATAGVEVEAWACAVTPEGLHLTHRLPHDLHA